MARPIHPNVKAVNKVVQDTLDALGVTAPFKSRGLSRDETSKPYFEVRVYSDELHAAIYAETYITESEFRKHLMKQCPGVIAVCAKSFIPNNTVLHGKNNTSHKGLMIHFKK